MKSPNFTDHSSIFILNLPTHLTVMKLGFFTAWRLTSWPTTKKHPQWWSVSSFGVEAEPESLYYRPKQCTTKEKSPNKLPSICSSLHVHEPFRRNYLNSFWNRELLAGIKALFIRQEVWALNHMLKSAKKRHLYPISHKMNSWLVYVRIWTIQ